MFLLFLFLFLLLVLLLALLLLPLFKERRIEPSLIEGPGLLLPDDFSSSFFVMLVVSDYTLFRGEIPSFADRQTDRQTEDIMKVAAIKK